MGDPAYDEGNVFARILRGEIPCDRVCENEHALAFRDVNPQAPVHVLVIPKGAYVSMADFSARATAAEIEGLMRAIGEAARIEGIEGGGYRFIANHGADAHQEVPHFHVHVCGGGDLGRMLKPPGR